MRKSEEIRLADLTKALSVTKGFPTQRALPRGEVRVMSVAALRNTAPPMYFAEREAILDIGLEVAHPGDLLVAIEVGTAGEAFVVPQGLEEFVPSQQAATLRVADETILDPWYLGAWLNTDLAREQLHRLARGTGIQRIPIKELGSLLVPVLPLADQREIGQRFFAFEAAIQCHRAVTACLEDMRQIDLALTFAEGSPATGPSKSKPKPKKVALHGR